MPISREEYRRGRIDLSIPVLDLIASRPDLAFTTEDVRQLLYQTAMRDASLGDVGLALETLVVRGEIELREIRGSQWYTIVEREGRTLGFLREQE